MVPTDAMRTDRADADVAPAGCVPTIGANVMANSYSSALPRLTPEQRAAAAGQFERANQVISTGNLDYGIQLLVNCCLIDPANPTYRQTLRKAQKGKFGEKGKGQNLAFLTSLRARLKVRRALKKGEYLKVLEFGEQVLSRN